MSFVRPLLLSTLLLTACSAPAPEAEPIAPSQEAPCCSLDEVLEMHAAGVDDDLIIASLGKSETPIEPSAQDLIRLTEAGVSKRVQQVLMGQEPDPAAEAEAEEAANAEEAAKPKPPPPLPIVVSYEPGAKKFTVTNTGGRTLTQVVMTANGDYVYRLPIPLPPGNPDNIKISSFTSKGSGHKLHPAEGLKSLHVKSEQGTWSKRF